MRAPSPAINANCNPPKHGGAARNQFVIGFGVHARPFHERAPPPMSLGVALRTPNTPCVNPATSG